MEKPQWPKKPKSTYLLKRQIDSKAETFLDNGGFSERMARMRRKN